MNAGNKHIVQTMCFDMQTNSEETAIAFAEKLRTLDCEVLLSKALQNYDDVLYKIKIDSLTIDVGNIFLNDFDLLEEEISRQLKEIFSQKFSLDIDRKNLFLNNEFDLQFHEKINNVQVETNIIETQIEILVFYLLNGSLPWNTIERPDIKTLLFEIAGKDSLKLKKALLPQLKKRIIAKRLAMILNFDEVIQLSKKIAGEELFITSEKIISILKQQFTQLQQSDLQKELVVIYLNALHEAIVESKNFDSVFIHPLQPLLKISPVSVLKSLRLHIQELLIVSGSNKEKLVYEVLIEELQKAIALQQAFITEPPIEEDQSPDIELPIKKKKLIKQKKSVVEEKIIIDETKIQNEEETVRENEYQYFYPGNAGLVLLNPAFMQKYFEQFGWVKDKKITGEISINKIITWTNYLVWGERKIYEYDLMLNKVLAGIQPEDLYDINISLTENERASADEFLQTIIKHWSILKSTSIEGFRTSFLQRKGRLKNEDGGWQLHVESKGIDILIDSLPWTFSIIKFPWMHKPLFTQWQTKI